MSNRVLLGKNTNTNHGHSGESPGYGCYISRKAAVGETAIDILSCTADELIFNTDKGSGTRIDKGIFQMVPTSTGTAYSIITVAPGQTGSVSLTEMGDNHIPYFPGKITADGVGNYAIGDTSVSITNPSTYVWSGTTYNSGDQTYTVSTFKGLSTDSIW